MIFFLRMETVSGRSKCRQEISGHSWPLQETKCLELELAQAQGRQEDFKTFT